MIPYFIFEEINLGFVSIQFWGLMVALGFVFGLLVFYYEAKRKKLDKNIILDLGLVILISAFVGARLFYVMNELPYFINNPGDIFKIWEGGLGFFGGLIFASFFSFLYLRRKKISFWLMSDSAVISLALAEFIGRIGCFAIHDHMGKTTSVSWGLEYFGEVRHETALYSMISTLFLFLLLFSIRKTRWGSLEGFPTSIYMIWYGATTFFIYSLRATDLPGADPIWGLFRPSQYFSFILLILGVILLTRMLRKKNLTR